jgi:hypothetical protein
LGLDARLMTLLCCSVKKITVAESKEVKTGQIWHNLLRKAAIQGCFANDNDDVQKEKRQ